MAIPLVMLQYMKAAIFQFWSHDSGLVNQRGIWIDPEKQNLRPISATTSLFPNVYNFALIGVMLQQLQKKTVCTRSMFFSVFRGQIGLSSVDARHNCYCFDVLKWKHVNIDAALVWEDHSLKMMQVCCSQIPVKARFRGGCGSRTSWHCSQSEPIAIWFLIIESVSVHHRLNHGYNPNSLLGWCWSQCVT